MRGNARLIFTVLWGLTNLASCFGGEFSLANIFSDRMVLQQNKPVPIWGWAEPGARVTVAFNDQEKSGAAGPDGKWEVTLDPMPAMLAGQPMDLICGDASKSLCDVVVGEVWFAGGQSNMAFSMQQMARLLPEGERMVAAANLALIRFRRVQGEAQATPQADLSDASQWEVTSRANVLDFSAVAYVFAHRLHRELDVPVGIIDCSWGGKPIEPFIPLEAMTGHPTLAALASFAKSEDIEAIRRLPGGTFARDPSWLTGRIFHARVAPVARYAIRGVIWYQGESNGGIGEDPRDYAHKMRALIRGWRKAWQAPELPFYYVQLPKWRNYAWPWLREQQQRALDTPHTGMVVTIDLDNGDSIHPPNKIDVGERLARWPLAEEYGQEVVAAGPAFQRAVIDGRQVLVYFQHAHRGLTVGQQAGVTDFHELSSGTLYGFELQGTEGGWREADARIDGSKVIVTSERVEAPVAVRYACHPQAPEGKAWNLYNREGLPASPFCSDWRLMPYDPAKNLPPDQD